MPDPFKRAVSDLTKAVSDAQAEVQAHGEALEQREVVRDQKKTRRNQWRQWGPLLATTTCAMLIWTWWLLPDQPNADQLQRGREVILQMAEQSLLEHINRHGVPPKDFSIILPVASDVRIYTDHDRVHLTITGSDGHVLAQEVKINSRL